MKLSYILPSVLFFFILIAGIAREIQKPDMVSREDWSAKPATGEIPEHEITRITIHHGGVDFPEDKDPIQYMRDLQTFSQKDKNWIDIPYHFCIDLKGKIYEARDLKYPGDTNTEYDPAGHALINVMGNYENQEVSEEQLEALAHLTAWLAQEYNVELKDVASHRDYSEQTVCPGKNLYKYFENGVFSQKVDSLLTTD